MATFKTLFSKAKGISLFSKATFSGTKAKILG
jgi:hypothetical protein